MRSIFLYFILISYVLFSGSKKRKLESLYKNASKEEAEKYLHEIVMNWANYMLNSIGIKVEVRGLENLPEGNCVFIANHQGDMDIPVILANIDKSMGFIAKKEILKIKILSYWMKQIKCIFIDRENIRESVKVINEGIEVVKNGHSMVIFPEGTRSKGPVVGEFKKGSMKLGLKSGVPIVPIAIDGTYKAREANHNKLTRANVTLTILKPINPNELSKEEYNGLSEKIREDIINCLAK
jgi:1-acyl-sn-glycerol-3-phosphate acyltransferase